MRGGAIKLNITIDLNVIRQNIKRIRESIDVRGRAGVKAIFMVKSDAYGHGLERVALATQELVDAFGVATICEGERLREAGIEKEILVLVCAPYELKRAIGDGLTIGLYCFAQLEALERLIETGEVSPHDVRVHIKADTGMHRLGFAPDEVNEVVARLEKAGVRVEGVYSHLRARAYSQKEEFMRAVAVVKTHFPSACAHLAASENLSVSTLRFDAVRIGIAAYRGAMTVTSEVVQARRIEAGERVSYGNFKVKKDTNTAIVFGGYGDGVKREFPSHVVIRGQKCGVLGRVCMDMFVVDTGDMLAEVGEKVILFSPETAASVARDRKTIDYAVMTGWHGRCERSYVDKVTGEEESP